MALKTTHAAGDPILAADMNSQASAIIQNEHNILELYLENYFAAKITPFKGLFFDGFSDTTKTDTSGGAIITNASSGQPVVEVDDVTGLAVNQEVDIYDETAGDLETKVIQSINQPVNTHSADLESSSSQSLEVNSETGLAITGDITVEAWIKPETVTGSRVIVARFDTGTGNGYELSIQGTTLQFRIKLADIADTITFASAVSLETWTHVAATRDNSTKAAKLYVNGAQVASNTGTRASIGTGDKLRIGRNSSGDFFDGNIDDVRVWNVVRLGTEIAQTYNSELITYPSSLKGYWKLNNSLLDETANNNDLTNVASVVFDTDIPFTTSAIAAITFTTNLANAYSTAGFVNRTSVDVVTASKIIRVKTALLAGNYRSKLQTLQNAVLDVALWVERNYDNQFNLDANISASATSLQIDGDQTAIFANGDTIDISNPTNTKRERRVLNATPTFGGGKTTLSWATGLTNAYTTADFVERVDVLPQVSLVAEGADESFTSPTYSETQVDFTNAFAEDEYTLNVSPAKNDYILKIGMTKNTL